MFGLLVTLGMGDSVGEKVGCRVLRALFLLHATCHLRPPTREVHAIKSRSTRTHAARVDAKIFVTERVERHAPLTHRFSLEKLHRIEAVRCDQCLR
jgi:hypothetical protein